MTAKLTRSVPTHRSDHGSVPPSAARALTRRELLAAGATTALLVAAGCGSNESDDSASSESGRTVEHKYGTTTVPDAPERVVTIGLIDHDAVLALGVIPVAVTANEFSEDQPHGVWTWAQEALGDGEPEVLPYPEINFEQITLLNPDLIIAVYSGLTEAEYDRLSRIAPTVAQSGDYDDYETPWDEMTRVIGRALSKEDEANDLIDGVEELFADMRAEHPEFDGKVAVYAGFYEAGQYYAETEGSTRVGILTGLGFTAPDDIRGDGFFADISQEQVDLFDRDVVLWELGDQTRKDAIQSDPIYAQLDVAREGRDVFITDPDLAGGLALISVLSLPYVVDELVPKLAAAVDGDPDTPVPD